MWRRVMMVALLVCLVIAAVGGVMFWPAVRDILTGRGLVDTTPREPRPARWAQPVELTGVENLYRIHEGLYRGAQPSEEGFRQLAAMGVKAVVNLRDDDDDTEKLCDTGLMYVHIPTEAWRLHHRDVAAFLKAVVDPACQPVFFHCHRGADRSGVMAAAYRVVVQGWSKDAAVEEMTRGGYGFNPLYAGLVDVVRELPVEDLRQQLSLVDSSATNPADESQEPMTRPEDVDAPTR